MRKGSLVNRFDYQFWGIALTFHLCLLVGVAKAQTTGKGLMPAEFKNNLVTIKMPLARADSLNFYVDTGGKNFLYKSGLTKLGLKKKKGNLWSSEFEQLFNAANVPMPDDRSLQFNRDKTATEDGMLGREWFAGKVWHFDYQNKALSCVDVLNKSDLTGESISLFFKKDSVGNHIFHLPRMEIIVDSDTLSVLLDTGAQAFLSKEAQQIFEKSEKVAASFINASIFTKWSIDHPEWSVLKGGDRSFGKKADVIMVPEIRIGKRKLGPVAFAKRKDYNFKNMSVLFMDKEISGALGGNALSKLDRLILDYKNEKLLID